MEPKYRFAWRSKLTGATGRGDPLPKHIVDANVAWANEKFPDLDHWVELVIETRGFE